MGKEGREMLTVSGSFYLTTWQTYVTYHRYITAVKLKFWVS